MLWHNSSKSCGPIADNQAALYGAGQAAFQLGRYRTAQGYLRSAVRRDPQNTQPAQSLKIATLVLEADPFAPRISDAERSRRVTLGISGGRRSSGQLRHKPSGIDLSPRSPSGGLPALKAQWLEMAPKVAKLRPPRDGGAPGRDYGSGFRNRAADASHLRNTRWSGSGPPSSFAGP